MGLREEDRRALKIGREAARANLMPMVALQAFAIGLSAAYVFCPGFRCAVEPVAVWHRACDWRAAFVSQMFFSGFFPCLFFLFCRSLRPCRPFPTVVAQTLWCGFLGVCSNAFFRFLATVWGDEARPATVIVKMLTDQFVWTPAFIAPANAVFFFWLGRDFSFSRTRAEWPRPFFRRLVLPNLLSNWIVWIPVSLAVFSVPQALQIHLNGLVCAFWTMMCLQIGRRA